jgi:hypothetical protein
MADKFQDCKVQEVNSAALCWKFYWYWLKNFNNLVLFLLLCTPIALVFLPLIFSGYNWMDAASNTLASMLFIASTCLAFLWIFIYFLSLSKVRKI